VTLPSEPRQRLAVVTCMDARIDVYRMLDLQLGDAHVIRNAGGRVTEDVIRSLALSQAFLGTNEIKVVHHTGCAMRVPSDAELAEGVRRAADALPPFAMLAIADEQEAIRADVAALRESPFLAHRDQVRGLLYDLETGQLTEVTAQ